MYYEMPRVLNTTVTLSGSTPMAFLEQQKITFKGKLLCVANMKILGSAFYVADVTARLWLLEPTLPYFLHTLQPFLTYLQPMAPITIC